MIETLKPLAIFLALVECNLLLVNFIAKLIEIALLALLALDSIRFFAFHLIESLRLLGELLLKLLHLLVKRLPVRVGVFELLLHGGTLVFDLAKLGLKTKFCLVLLILRGL